MIRKKLSNTKLGIILLVFVALCAKVVKARWYDVSSKLSIFAASDTNHDDIAS